MPQGEVKVYEGCNISDGAPCLPCQQSIKLEAQIVAAKEPALNNLLILRRDLRTEINHHHDPITRRLPPELTSRVFEICSKECGPYNSSDWEIPQYQSSTPLILGAVCQTWRHIAWSLPSLWTRICISLEAQMEDAYVDKVEGWLQRSGQLPLSMLIDLDFSSESTTRTNAGFRRIISIINQHSNHWQNLGIKCHPEQLRLICGDSRGAPILRNLSITGLGSSPGANYIFNSTMDAMKPRPSCVQLDDIHFKSVGIHWSDVTDIALIRSCIHLDECIELLQQTPQLVYCHIEGIDAAESEDWQDYVLPDQPVVLHGLQSLFLSHYEGEDIGMFFQSFTFPNLTHLQLANIDDEDISLWSSITSLTNRSSMCLTHLSIHYVDCDFETLMPILQNLPCMVNLNIKPSHHTDIQVHLLLSALANGFFLDTSGHYQTLFLPKLESICCWGCDSASWDSLFWQSISQLSGPWEDGELATGGRPIRSVSTYGNGDWELDVGSRICTDRNILLRLVKLSRSGVKFKLWSNNVDLLDASMKHHGMT
ncbi:hypothetical protein CVT25_013798 [Psilocybe cyanescens]|uniref:Uncharacterized protein n=1 Tax=Psilocybe cyanescens TaxID=93625 RepID=A0A409X1T3_PSICY|nr:hypothetical protein CVT25_013798 [Psilocybe cyanescens]